MRPAEFTPAGVQQEEAEEKKRRRGAVLLLVGLAAVAVLVFWLWVSGQLPAAVPQATAAPAEGVADVNVVLVGFNGSQKFSVWAPPGSIALWDVAFCNVAYDNMSVVVKVVEVPREVRRFLFYINETRFGWDGVNYTEWHTLFRPRSCLPGKLELVIDGRAARNTAYLIKIEVSSHPQS